MAEYSNSDFLKQVETNRIIVLVRSRALERQKWVDYWKQKHIDMLDGSYARASEKERKQIRAVDGSRKLTEWR